MDERIRVKRRLMELQSDIEGLREMKRGLEDLIDVANTSLDMLCQELTDARMVDGRENNGRRVDETGRTNMEILRLIECADNLGIRTTFDAQVHDSKSYWAYLKGIETALLDLAQPGEPGYVEVQIAVDRIVNGLIKHHAEHGVHR